MWFFVSLARRSKIDSTINHVTAHVSSKERRSSTPRLETSLGSLRIDKYQRSKTDGRINMAVNVHRDTEHGTRTEYGTRMNEAIDFREAETERP
jgi:hypothetical protein